MATNQKTIGVLALQGDFSEHCAMLDKLRIPCFQVRTLSDLKKTDGLIIPGGESTTIGKLLRSSGIGARVQENVKQGYAVYGTCAGAILIANQVDSPYTLKLIDITMKRNAYGRQLDSFDEPLVSSYFPTLRGVFIRAPLITAHGKAVTVLATHRDNPVLVRKDKILAGTFHPELTEQLAVHKYFYSLL